TRERDVLGRLGGEEFAVLITACSFQKAQELAERLRAEVNRLPRPDGVLSISMGVAQFRAGETLEQLLGRADQAMLRAKRNGRNRIELDGSII
ncbi:MAG: GGDEF domain-containing protein, partial [Pseudomonadota bacterium]